MALGMLQRKVWEEWPIGSKRTILLVEDNKTDVDLVKRALLDGPLVPALIVAEDGVEALNVIRGGLRPDLILLDLNLPRKSGHQVISELKEHPEYRRIPIVVLTSSRADRDVFGAYQGHANCYVTKPMDIDEFSNMLHSLQEFWLLHATLPS